MNDGASPMRGWRRPLAFTLTCAVAVSAMAANQPQAAAPGAEKSAAAARNKALASFQGDLINVLAPSADAQRLLAAALLARPLPNQSKVNTFHALVERAAHADDAGPAESWARLADCDAKTSSCPNADAVAQLVQQA